MKSFYLMILLGLLMACRTGSPNSQSSDLAELKTSPFEAIQFDEKEVHVLVDSSWYQFIKMDSLAATFLLDQCRDIYDKNYQKRFSEDFVEFLHKMDVYPKASETFSLMDSNEQVMERRLSFTKANRSKAQSYFRENYADVKVNLEAMISREQMVRDLDQIAKKLKHSYSYLHLKAVNVPVEIQQLKASLPEQMTVRQFGVQINGLIGKFGDGHSGISDLKSSQLGQLPFRTADFQGNIVAFQDEKLLSEDYPFLYSINGHSVAALLETVQSYLIQDGSPQFKAFYSANRLKNIGQILKLKGDFKEELDFILTNEDQDTIHQKMTMTFPEVEEEKSAMEIMLDYRSTNPFSTEKLEGNLGYLRIEKMISPAPEEQIDAVMKTLKDTDGLIIDVRNNGGGGRQILLDLLPRFMKAEQAPIIGNLAVYRTDRPDQTEGFMKNRYSYPLSSSTFSEGDRQHIQAFMVDFQPGFAFDTSQFSDWHYLLIKPGDPAKYYDKPIVVLQNGACFSATDIFLGAFKELPAATLMGSPSGGGSGRSQDSRLKHSKLELRLSSIISFQPNGQLYDGIGVHPDIVVEPKAISDIIGTTDNQLDAAIQYLQEQGK